MIAEQNEDIVVAGIAAAIGEPARTRILYCLLDGHARTSTELAIIAEVSPSTASVHLQRLVAEGLIKVLAQGKHRYYSLAGRKVGRALEALSVLAGGTCRKFVPSTPNELRFARTCYDHMAGAASVLSITDSRLWDGFQENRQKAIVRMISVLTELRRLKLSGLMSKQIEHSGADSRIHALIGVKGSLTSAARWARPFCKSP